MSSPTSSSQQQSQIEASGLAESGIVEEPPQSRRSVKPLGTARRPARSKTPTPTNPHPRENQAQNPFPIASPSSFVTANVASPTSKNTTFVQPATTETRRPWFPFPAAAVARNPSPSSKSVGMESNTRLQKTLSSSSSSSAYSVDSFVSRRQGPNGQQRQQNVWQPSTNFGRPMSRDPSSYSALLPPSTGIFASRGDRGQRSERASGLPTSHRSRRASIDFGPLSRVPVDHVEQTHEGRSTASIAQEMPHEEDETYEGEKERAHFQKVLKAFDMYLPLSLAANNAQRRSFYALPRMHRLLLSSLGPVLPGPVIDKGEGSETSSSDLSDATTVSPAGRGFKARLDEMDDRVRRNADVLSQVVADSRDVLGSRDSAERDAKEVAAFAHHDGDQSVSSIRAAAPDSPKEEAEERSDEGDIDDNDAKSGDDAEDDVENDRSHSSADSRDTTTGSAKQEPSGDKKGSKSRKVSPSNLVSDHDVDKVRSMIKQFVRDWSDEGVVERRGAYEPILNALEHEYGHLSASQRANVSVLVPGAGLGRLAFEIAWEGFKCQGNEFSFYMLLASHFVLNKTSRVRQHVIYPFVHSSSNWHSAADMLRPVSIPDVNPTDLPASVDFSMVAGEFVEVYGKPQERARWQVVATCFFIDTAHNFARYVEVINHVMPVGGVWINVGPLLWHYEGAQQHRQQHLRRDERRQKGRRTSSGATNASSSSSSNGSVSASEISIELTLEEVIDLIELMGFKIEHRQTLPAQPYTGNAYSMLTYQYVPEFWIARKVRTIAHASDV